MTHMNKIGFTFFLTACFASGVLVGGGWFNITVGITSIGIYHITVGIILFIMAQVFNFKGRLK